MWNKSSLEGELLDSLHLLTAVHLLEPAPLWSFEVFSTLPLKLDHMEQVKLGRAASWSHHRTLAALLQLAIFRECSCGTFFFCSLNSPPQAWIEWGSKLGSEQPWVFTNQWLITTSVTALHCSWQWAMPSSFSWIGEELRTLLVHLKHHSTSRED